MAKLSATNSFFSCFVMSRLDFSAKELTKSLPLDRCCCNGKIEIPVSVERILFSCVCEGRIGFDSGSTASPFSFVLIFERFGKVLEDNLLMEEDKLNEAFGLVVLGTMS